LLAGQDVRHEEELVLAVGRAERETRLTRRQLRKGALHVVLDDGLIHPRGVLQVCRDGLDAVLRRREVLHDRQTGRALRRAAAEAAAELVAGVEDAPAVVRLRDQEAEALDRAEALELRRDLRRAVRDVAFPRP